MNGGGEKQPGGKQQRQKGESEEQLLEVIEDLRNDPIEAKLNKITYMKELDANFAAINNNAFFGAKSK